jgi:hypothetical protein
MSPYGDLTFAGHDWENLNRLVALVKFQTLIDSDLYYQDDDGNRTPNEGAQCATLASRFVSPALDWVASKHATEGTLFRDFSRFITAVRQGFGIDDDNLKALCQTKLDNLRYGSDVPTFFAELDRLFLALGIDGHDTKIAHAMGKLPLSVKATLADQGRQFHNYDTMRGWMNTRWALLPQGAAVATSGGHSKPGKCSNCGKKGHVASVCRKPKN